MILIGQACFLIGDVCFALLEHVFHSDAYPNIGDIFYVGGYPFIAVGLVMLLRSRGTSRDAGGVIDGFIVATSVGVLLWVFFVVPTAFDHTLPVFERLINVAYPAGDLLLIAIGAQLAVRQVRRQAPYWIVSVALLALLVADLGYLYQSLYGVYNEGDPIDFGWWISYALIVAVLLHPRVGDIAAAPQRQTPRLSPRRIIVLSLVTVAAPLTIAARSAAGASLELPVLLGGTVMLFGLVVARLVVMARELEVSRTLLLHEATHDALTGLGNRTLFSDQVERSLSSGIPVAVLCLDLDDFKLVNDSLGHPAGDVVLRVVGERLSGLLRPGDAVARLGGDEFAMLVSGPDPAAGGAVAQRALAAIRQPIALPGGRTVHSNVSVGVAHSNGDSSVEALLRDADIAMYLAKQSGKGHHEIFQPGMRQDVIDRLEMRVDLADALARNEFVLHYQPIIEVATGQPVGVEALLRWEHPRRGRVEPMQFIPLAEETELIIPIGRWVLMEACRRAVELDPRRDGLEIAVNVSAVQLRDPGLVDDVQHALGQLWSRSVTADTRTDRIVGRQRHRGCGDHVVRVAYTWCAHRPRRLRCRVRVAAAPPGVPGRHRQARSQLRREQPRERLVGVERPDRNGRQPRNGDGRRGHRGARTTRHVASVALPVRARLLDRQTDAIGSSRGDLFDRRGGAHASFHAS